MTTEPQYSIYLRKYIRYQEVNGMFILFECTPCQKVHSKVKYTNAMNNEWFHKPFFLN